MGLILCTIFPNISFASWKKTQGFPEIGYYDTGYSISGSFSPVAELAIFPKVNMYGIQFKKDGKWFSPDKLNIAISFCNNIEKGITKNSQIISSTDWGLAILLCNKPIYVSVDSGINKTTIYRFPNDYRNN